MEGLSHTSEGLCSQVLTLKIALNQAIGGFTDQQSYWVQPVLRCESNVGDFTQRQLFLTSCSTHLPHNDQPRMHPYTDGELDTFGLLQTLIQVSQSIEDT